MWSDGTPITADDFIYNWQAQSGNPAYTDVGGKPYDAASTAGYSQIQSVVGSDPSGGATCSAGSAADRNAGLCPNGRTVTVTFKPSFTDWRAPLHQHRAGACRPDGGLEHRLHRTDARPSRAAGSRLQSYNENQSLVLARNPSYWGTPAKLDKLVFQFFSADSQLVPAMQNHEVDIINPSHGEPVHRADGQPGARARGRRRCPGLEFEHFDFNQADPYLAKVQVREAIAHGVNRQAIINRTVGEVAMGITPLGSRMLVPTQPGYKATSYSYDPSQSVNLLKELGYKKASDGYFQPNSGPQKGQDLTFTIQSTSGNTVRCPDRGAVPERDEGHRDRINIQNHDANTLRHQPVER